MAEQNGTARERFGSCVRCGRALQNEESMKAGMGPTCRAKAGRSDSGRLLEDQPVLVGVPPLLEAGLICRRLEDGRAACNVPQIVVQHSPTGFEWGYGGSGPADLALNVLHLLLPGKLLHDFGNGRKMYEGELVGGVGVSLEALRLHQDFKRRFIEPLPAAGGVVSLEEMRAWIVQQLVAEAA